MPEIVRPSNPYARPINATRPEGQMLQGEFYGKRADDKQLAGLHGREVSPASRYYGKAAVAPADMDAVPPPKPKRPRGPKADKVIIDEPPTESVGAVTEDDLFG